jgi:hypothetical protein
VNKKNYSLADLNGNSIAIMAYTITALRESGRTKEQIDLIIDKVRGRDKANLIIVFEEEIKKLNNGE